MNFSGVGYKVMFPENSSRCPWLIYLLPSIDIFIKVYKIVYTKEKGKEVLVLSHENDKIEVK